MLVYSYKFLVIKYVLQIYFFNQGIDYVSEKKTNASGSKYKDKAEIRRKTVGSQNPYEKTEAASMEE